MKRFLLIFTVTLIATISSGCIFRKDKWQAVYYPDGCLTCEDKYIYSPVYDNSIDCAAWIGSKRSERNFNEADQWECGKNCKNKDGFLLCQETDDFM